MRLDVSAGSSLGGLAAALALTTGFIWSSPAPSPVEAGAVPSVTGVDLATLEAQVAGLGRPVGRPRRTPPGWPRRSTGWRGRSRWHSVRHAPRSSESSG